MGFQKGRKERKGLTAKGICILIALAAVLSLSPWEADARPAKALAADEDSAAKIPFSGSVTAVNRSLVLARARSKAELFESMLRRADKMQHIVVNDNVSYSLAGVKSGYILVEVNAGENIGCVLRSEEADYSYLALPDGVAVIPVNMGDVSYEFQVVKKVEGTTYEILEKTFFDGMTADETIPFNEPNYMVWYDADASFIEEAAALRSGFTDEDAARNISRWVHSHVNYDWEKAEILGEKAILSDNIPDPDQTYKEKKGVCLDKAALTTAMCRSVGIPARLVFGWHEEVYHAWTEAYIGEGTWMLIDPTAGIEEDTTGYTAEKYF